MAKRQRNRRLSKRNRQILLLAKIGMVTVQIVHPRFFAGQSIEAARSALRRLVERGYLDSRPLDTRRVYYRLTTQGARAVGVSPKDIPTLKKQGRAKWYAVSWFIQADQPGKRALINPHDYPEQFPVAGQRLPRGPFFLDRSGEKPRLGIIMVDHNADQRRICRKTLKILGRFLRKGWFDEFISQDAFVVTILTFSERRKQVFDRRIPPAITKQFRSALSRLRPDMAEGTPTLVQVCVVPGLDAIVTHPQDQQGMR